MENGSSTSDGESHGAPHRSRPFKVKSWGRMVSIRNTKPSADEEQELSLGKNLIVECAADQKIVCSQTSNDVVLVEPVKTASSFADHTQLITQRSSVRSASSSLRQTSYREADITISGEQ